MGIEGFDSNPVNKGETEMNIEESLETTTEKLTASIRIYAESFLKNRKEIQAGPWKIMKHIATGDFRTMQETASAPAIAELGRLLGPVGEPVPRTDEDMELLLEKLDTPLFQKKIRDGLSVNQG